jgi:hypothetical protein
MDFSLRNKNQKHSPKINFYKKANWTTFIEILTNLCLAKVFH